LNQSTTQVRFVLNQTCYRYWPRSLDLPFNVKIIQLSMMFVLPWKQTFKIFLPTSFPEHNSKTVEGISTKFAAL